MKATSILLNFLTVCTVCMSYKLVFYPGSQIRNSKYLPLLQIIKTKTNITEVSFGRYLPLTDYKNDTIIIGHSFGGYFGLLNCMKNVNNVKGCILINSHFNQRYKMPYFSIPIKKVEQPVLTILSEFDSILPLENAIDDFFITSEENLDNKFFKLINSTHTSHFHNYENLEELSTQISNFILNIDSNDFTNFYKEKKNLESKFLWKFQRDFTKNTRECSISFNLMDALLEISNFPLWHELHFLYFLFSKPYGTNFMYSTEKSVLYKTKNINETKLKQFLEKRTLKYFKTNNVTWKLKKNPIDNNILNLALLPYQLLYWLLCTPKVKVVNNTTLEAEVFVVKIFDDIIYYKFPSKFAVFSGLTKFRRNSH